MSLHSATCKLKPIYCSNKLSHSCQSTQTFIPKKDLLLHLHQKCGGAEISREIIRDDFEASLSYNGKTRIRYERNYNSDSKPAYLRSRTSYFTNQKLPRGADRTEFFSPILLESSRIGDYCPQIFVTAFFTHKQLYRSLIAVRIVADCEMTSLASQVVARFSIKNTKTDTFSPPESLRFVVIKCPSLALETFPKISVPNRFQENTEYVFRDNRYKNTLFFDWNYIFNQKGECESILKVMDFHLCLTNVDRFLESPVNV